MSHIERSFKPIPQSVCQARSFVTLAIGCHVDAAVCDDVQICVSELASNVLRHCNPKEGEFTVRVSLDSQGSVRMEVHDRDSDTHSIETRIRDMDFYSTHGRGMFIIEQLSEDWGVETTPNGKVIWTQFSAAAQAAA